MTRPSAAAAERCSGLSVVVPVFNSAETLAALVERLRPVLAACTDEFELVLVNDGSGDSSWKAVEELAAANGWIHGIDLMRNFGQHNALLCGIRASRYDVVVTLDDDLQNPPEEIPKLLAKLAEGFDVVYGRPAREQHGLLRDVASRVTKMALQGAMGAETAASVSAFRAFRGSLREALTSRGPFVSIDVLLTWGTTRFSAVTVQHDPRREGRSNYTFQKLVTHAFNMATGFSVRPLQLATWTGFACTGFGFAVLAWVVGRVLLQGTTVPGFAFLASIVAIFSGAQLFALGIIGEYLARMHFRTMDKPPYVVRHTTAAPRESQGDRCRTG